LVASLTRTAVRPATAALRIVEGFDGPGSLDALGPVVIGLEAAAWLNSSRRRRSAQAEPVPTWLNQGVEARREAQAVLLGQRYFNRRNQAELAANRVRKVALLSLGLLKLGQLTGAFAGTGLGRLSRREAEGVSGGLEQRFFFANSSHLPVRLWPSRLTPLLNRLIIGPGRIRSSDGVMFEVKGKTWHRGAVVVKTVQGERTITHLHSLALPATHYYFNRRLTDNEAVGIVSAQKGFEPKFMPGYAGQISEVEALFPLWAQVKRTLIKSHLLWGDQAPSNSEPASSDPRTQARAAGPGQPLGPERYPPEKIGDRVKLGEQNYPVIVRRLTTGSGQGPLAEAAYYDEVDQVWREVTDDQARRWLAGQVKAGRLKPWED
jgi:hypothetical protein